jgi:molybdate transport system ATP-binding protein
VTDIEARFRLVRPGFVLDVDLCLPGRGVTVLFGPSGCGKTTLLRSIAGLEREAQGRCVVNGEVWQDEGWRLPTHRRAVGFVFQEASLFPHLSVKANLEYGRRRLKRPPRLELKPLIDLLALRELLPRRPAGLSGGERQRVAIARALAAEPRLLLMDEPLAGLDLSRRREVLPFLRRLREELDIPMLYVTHSSEELAWLADHVVVLTEGRVQAKGSLRTLCTHPVLARQLGEEAGVVLQGVVGEVDGAWGLARVDFAGGSLWVRHEGAPARHPVRVRVLARDVSLATHPGVTSIQNLLAGRLHAILDDTHPALCLAEVKVGEEVILARLTRRALAQLGVAPGQPLFAQVKTAALC